MRAKLLDRPCAMCSLVLCPSASNVSPLGKLGTLVTPEGQTVEKIGEAAHNGCYICSKAWDVISPKLSSWHGPSRSEWEGLTFGTLPEEVGLPTSEPEFYVTFHYPTRNFGSISFKLSSSVDEDVDNMLPAPFEENSTGSTSTLNIVRGWFDACMSTHSECKHEVLQPAKPSMPMRLIEVGEETGTDWRIVISSAQFSAASSHGPYPPYMTLSYRWGADPRLLLTNSTLADFQIWQPVSRMPRTFQDFIQVARHLGIRYIWIDSLCILQDSFEEWGEEAGKMMDIYARSACNVLAAASENPEDGLFRIRDPKYDCYGKVRAAFTSSEAQEYYITARDGWDDQLGENVLSTRGWVFQEWFLAPRRLYFGKHQALWDCESARMSEAFPQGIPFPRARREGLRHLQTLVHNSNHRPGTTSDPCLDLWLSLLEMYSKSELTYQSDKLIAIAGIARLFKNLTGDVYYAGLWGTKIITQLAWRAADPKPRPPNPCRAPSWSWASIDGPVEMSYITLGNEPLTSLLEINMKPDRFDMTTSVDSCNIELRGIVLNFRYEHTYDVFVEGVWSTLNGGPEEGAELELSYDVSDIEIPESGVLRLLFYAPNSQSRPCIFIILEPVVGTERDSNNVFRRVGLCFSYEWPFVGVCGEAVKSRVPESIMLI